MKINLFKNINDIVIDRNSNITIVTGLSGSGKSYITKKLLEKKTILIQLDYLKHPKYANDFGKQINEKFQLKYPEVTKYMENKFFKINESEDLVYKEYINKYFDFIINEINKNEKYIIEGIQVFSLIDYEKIENKNYNIYIKGTSSIKSLINRIKRDYDDEEKISFLTRINFFKRVIKDSVTFQFKHRKTLNEFIKKIERVMI